MAPWGRGERMLNEQDCSFIRYAAAMQVRAGSEGIKARNIGTSFHAARAVSLTANPGRVIILEIDTFLREWGGRVG